jgi:hypothetical protein
VSTTIEKIKEFRFIWSLLIILGLPIFLVYRDNMKAKPLTALILIWSLSPISILITEPWIIKIPWMGVLIGAAMNMTAIWMNNGEMPVLNMDHSAHGLWRPMQSTDRVKFLCDILPSHMSYGDVVIVTFIILSFVATFLDKYRLQKG